MCSAVQYILNIFSMRSNASKLVLILKSADEIAAMKMCRN